MGEANLPVLSWEWSTGLVSGEWGGLILELGLAVWQVLQVWDRLCRDSLMAWVRCMCDFRKWRREFEFEWQREWKFFRKVTWREEGSISFSSRNHHESFLDALCCGNREISRSEYTGAKLQRKYGFVSPGVVRVQKHPLPQGRLQEALSCNQHRVYWSVQHAGAPYQIGGPEEKMVGFLFIEASDSCQLQFDKIDHLVQS